MKQFLKLVCLLLSALGCSQLYAQRPAGKQGQAAIDSMLLVLPNSQEDTNKVRLLNNLSFTYFAINPDEGIKYGQQALALATRLDWKKGMAKADNCIGVNYHFKSDFTRALEYYFKTLKIAEETGDKVGVANVSGNIGGVYERQGDYAKALEYCFKALKIDEETGDKKTIADFTGNIGGIYQLQGEYAKALEYYFKALKIDEEIGNEYGLATSTGNIGQVYGEMKNYTGSLEYLERSLKIAENIGYKYLVAGNLYTIGSSYVSLVNDTARGNPVVAAKEIAVAKYKPNGTIPTGKAALLRNAIDYLQRGLAIAKEMQAMDIMRDCYKKLAEAYTLNGDYKKALESTNDYLVIKDSVFSKDKDEQIMKLTLKNEYDRQHLADSLKVSAKEKITAIELKRQRGYTYMGIAGILLLAGFSFFIIKERGRSEKERKKSDDLLLNILPAEVATELKINGTTTAKHYDNVTVLFTDFVDFTSAGGRMSPQALIDELHTCFKAFDDITGKYQIEKIKTIGDAYLAVSGLPTPDPKHAENCVRAATETNAFMHNRQAKLGNNTFEIRIGIHSGSVVAGIVGVKKFAYDVWGDTVNTAARMEQSGESGKVNISETTYELVKDKFICENRGEIEVKGKGMLKMYFVNG